RRRYRIEPESYRTESSVANIGGLRAGRVAESRGTQFRTRGPMAEAVWLTVIERGAGRLVLPGSEEAVIGNAATGVIRGRRRSATGWLERWQHPAQSLAPGRAPPQEAGGSAGRADDQIRRIPADFRSDPRRRRHNPPHAPLPLHRAGVFRLAADKRADDPQF